MPSNENNVSDESKDLENPAVLLIAMSDAEKYNKFCSIKSSLLSFDHTSQYPSTDFMRCMSAITTYSVCSTIIGIICVSVYPDDSVAFKFGLGTFASSIISWGATLAPCFSTKCRAYLVGKINKPLTLPTDFNLADFNKLLSSVGLMPIEQKNISSTKHLQGICKTIQVAIEQTDTFKLLALGNAVKAGLPSTGFFSDRNKLILNYLITNEEILNKIEPHPQLKK